MAKDTDTENRLGLSFRNLTDKITTKGKLYEGYWENDLFEGKGIEIFPQGMLNYLG